MSALSTEHFVLQTAANATVSDAAARSSLYVLSLSSALVAIGFASRSEELLTPFLLIVLPGVFVLGLFTIVRLVDGVLENMRCLGGIARIRAFYRSLTPDAATYFSPRYGRWPEGIMEPALMSGPLVGFATTSASMISFINSLVAGTGMALVVAHLFPQYAGAPVFSLGVLLTAALMVLSLAYQQRRTRNFLGRLGVSAEFALK